MLFDNLMRTHMIIPKRSDLYKNYNLILCDIWGVIHNGKDYYPKAVEFLMDFQKQGGLVFLITNAPRRSKVVREYLLNMGIDKLICENIVTSGDCSYNWICSISDKPIFHLGPKKDYSLFSDLDLNLSNQDSCSECICTGFFDEYTETLDDYEELLNTLLDRKIKIHCANPDLYVHRGEIKLPCAGLIAQKYNELGGEVSYFGKPYTPIYELALHEANERQKNSISKSDILAIGDGLHTDIAGADNFKIDSMFILNGVHKNEIVSKNHSSKIDIDMIRDYINSNFSLSAEPRYIQNELK